MALSMEVVSFQISKALKHLFKYHWIQQGFGMDWKWRQLLKATKWLNVQNFFFFFWKIAFENSTPCVSGNNYA